MNSHWQSSEGNCDEDENRLMRSQKTPFLYNFLFGFLTFGVGFLLGLLLHQRVAPALITAMVMIPVSYMVSLWAEFRHLQDDRHQRNSLRHQIHTLQAQHHTLQQTIQTTRHTQQEVNDTLRALELDRDRLLSRITELHQYRNELIHELRQYQQAQTPTPYPQSLGVATATQAQHQNAQQLEQYLHRLNNAIEVAQTDILDQQEALEAVQEDVARLTAEKAALQSQAGQLRQSLGSLKARRDELNDTVQHLHNQQTELPALQQERDNLQKRLHTLQAEHDTLMPQLTALQQQHQDLSGQVQQQQTQLAIAQQDYETAQNQLQDTLDTLTTTQNQLTALETQLAELQQPELPGRVYALASEWYEFVHALTALEKRALAAILDQDEAQIKALCHAANLEVPALVEALNETAIMTLGDLLLDFDTNTDLLTMNEDYAVIMAGSVAVLFRELLTVGQAEG
jgi:predicted  nucleic acid-binding Zn-ribbon protein